MFGSKLVPQITAAMSLALAVSSTGCSPSSLFGNGKDDKVENTRSYRTINTNCASVNLSSSTLDLPTFKALLNCLNSNGALKELVALTNALSDDELQPIVDLTNTYVLNDKGLLYELDTTYDMLSTRGWLDSSLVQLGRILENEEFIAAAIALLKEQVQGPQSAAGSLVARLSGEPFKPDPDLLKAIERISTKITTDNAESGIDAAMSLASSRVFARLQNYFRSENQLPLRAITDGLMEYAQDPRPKQYQGTGKLFINAAIDGSLFRALDEVMGTDSQDNERMLVKLPELANVMRALSARRAIKDDGPRDAAIFDGMTSLFHYLHGPIKCLQKSQEVKDATLYVISELSGKNTSEAADYIKRYSPLTLIAMNPFCDYPSQLQTYYPSMISLADTSAMEPATEMIKSFYRNGLASLLVQVLGDTGDAATCEHEDGCGIKRLLPLLSDLNGRGAPDRAGVGAIDDLFLTIALLRPEDRWHVVNALQFLIAPSDQLGGKSIYDVLMEVVSRTDKGKLYDLVYSMRRFTQSDQPLLLPALRELRRAYYVNDAHPIIHLTQRLMADATKKEKLYGLFFKISEMKEFRDTLTMASELAKNGQLKELLGATVTIFHRFALEGKTHDIRPSQEPPFRVLTRHDYTSADPDYAAKPLVEREWDQNDPCRRLSFSLPMDQYASPGYDAQIADYLACVNIDGKHGDFVRAIRFLRCDHSTSDPNDVCAGPTSSGGSFFNLQIDLVKSLAANLTQETAGDIGNRWIRSVDDGRFYRAMDALPLFVRRAFGGGPVLEPLLRVVRPIVRDVSEGVQRLMDYGATVLRREDIPHLLKYVEDVSDREPEPSPQPGHATFDLAAIDRRVRNKECELNAGARRVRAMEIIDDYNNTVTTWDLVNGRPRRSWTLDEFKAGLQPLFSKFFDPRQNNPDRSAIQATLNVLGYFTLQPGQPPNSKQHYPVDYLAQWLRERSGDYQLISFFYPGEEKPRVRLVDSLDRLELVLIAADLQYLLPDNMGVKFLQIIGEAYGDDPREAWPLEIQRKYTGSKKPLTLAEAYKKMSDQLELFETLVGYPKIPKCDQVADPTDPNREREGRHNILPIPLYVKATIFNLRQVLDVVKENLPNSGTRLAGGMKVLRDLFFELYYSSPPDVLADFDKAPRKGQRNNLTVIVKLVRMGLTRQVSRQLRNFPPIPSNPDTLSPEQRADYFALLDFFRSLIAGGTSPNVKPLVNALFEKDPNQQLLWGVVKEIFGVLDAPNGVGLTRENQERWENASVSDRAQLRNDWARDVLRMKQLAFYTLAQAGPLGIIEPTVKTAGTVLQQDYQYLAHNTDKIRDLLTSKTVSLFMRALYEDQDDEKKMMLAGLLGDALSDPQRALDGVDILKAVDQDAEAKRAWDAFSDRFDAVRDSEDYKKLNLKEIAKDLLHFLEETGRPETAQKLREYIADRIERGQGGKPSDIFELMQLIERKPQDVYQILDTAARHVETGDLKEFVKMARRALADPQGR